MAWDASRVRDIELPTPDVEVRKEGGCRRERGKWASPVRDCG